MNSWVQRRQTLGSAITDEDGIFDADDADAGQSDFGFNGDGHAGRER